MKTDIESTAIQRMCEELGCVASGSRNALELHYNNETEMITGFFNDQEVVISVAMDSVSASFRDVLRGLVRLA